MNVRVFSASTEKEWGGVNIECIEVELSDGRTVTFTEPTILKIIDKLDVSPDLHDWLMVVEHEHAPA